MKSSPFLFLTQAVISEKYCFQHSSVIRLQISGQVMAMADVLRVKSNLITVYPLVEL